MSLPPLPSQNFNRDPLLIGSQQMPHTLSNNGYLDPIGSEQRMNQPLGFSQAINQNLQPRQFTTQSFLPLSDREYMTNVEIQRLKDTIRSQEDKILSQLGLIDTLTLENNRLKNERLQIDSDAQQYKETLQKMYVAYVEQQKLIEELKQNNSGLVQNVGKVNEVNFDLSNDVKNVLVDRDILETRIKQGEQKYQFDIQSLTAQINDKNIEIAEMRRKLNDLLDIKRRLEEETAALRFALDNARAKMEAELREKQIKFEQLERAFQETNEIKAQEIAGSNEKIRECELEIRRLMDQCKNQSHEITIITKDLRFKEFELNKLRDNLHIVNPQSLQQSMQQSTDDQQYNNKENQYRQSNLSNKNNQQQQQIIQQQQQQLQQSYQQQLAQSQQAVNEESMAVKSQFAVLQEKIRNQQQDISKLEDKLRKKKAKIQQLKQIIKTQEGSISDRDQKLKQKSQSQESKQRYIKIEQNEDEDEEVVEKQQSKAQKGKIPKQFASRIHQIVEYFLNKQEKTFEQRFKYYIWNIWRHKFDIWNLMHQNKNLATDALEDQRVPNLLEHKNSQIDADWTDFLCSYFIKFYFKFTVHSFKDGIITVLSFTRTSVSNVVFEVFAKSVHQANEKKLNALNVFLANMKEIKEKYWKGLLLVIETYTKLRQVIKEFIPKLASNKLDTRLEKKLQLCSGKLLKYDVDMRDNVNKYIEGTLAQTISKKAADRLDKNRDYMFLFRLLTIKHRIRYPQRGKSFKVDIDLEIVLEHKICNALQRLITKE